MARFYMITNHPRYGRQKHLLKGVTTWRGAVDAALTFMSKDFSIMFTLKGIEIETE